MMKIIQIFILFFVLSFVAGCKPPTQSQPTPPPTPTPIVSTPAPTPTPTPTPIPTPQARLAPEGTLYVVKSFSKTTQDGIHGFSAGKKVTLIREEAGSYVVTDGDVEGVASKDSFTNNMDIVDSLTAKAKQQVQTIQQVGNDGKNSLAAKEAANNKVMADEKAARQKEQWNQNVAARKEALNALNKRISAARSERTSKGFPADGGPRDDYYHHTHHTVTLGTDASQIETLLAAKYQIEAQIRQLGANP